MLVGDGGSMVGGRAVGCRQVFMRRGLFDRGKGAPNLFVARMGGIVRDPM